MESRAKGGKRSDAGRLEIGFYTSLSAGPLRDSILASPPSIRPARFAKLLEAYVKQFPGIESRITNESRYRLMERLNSGSLDVVIVMGQFWSGGHPAMPAVEREIVIAPPETHRCSMS